MTSADIVLEADENKWSCEDENLQWPVYMEGGECKSE